MRAVFAVLALDGSLEIEGGAGDASPLVHGEGQFALYDLRGRLKGLRLEERFQEIQDVGPQSVFPSVPMAVHDLLHEGERYLETVVEIPECAVFTIAIHGLVVRPVVREHCFPGATRATVEDSALMAEEVLWVMRFEASQELSAVVYVFEPECLMANDVQKRLAS